MFYVCVNNLTYQLSKFVCKPFCKLIRSLKVCHIKWLIFSLIAYLLFHYKELIIAKSTFYQTHEHVIILSQISVSVLLSLIL